MSNERYITIPSAEWDEAVDKGRLQYADGLLDLEDAANAANAKASRTRRPTLLLKVVPVQLHRATVTLDVDALQ